jgi:hypothetical protein
MKFSSLLPSKTLVTDIWGGGEIIQLQNVQNPKQWNKTATRVEHDRVMTVNNFIKNSVLFNGVFRFSFCKPVRLNAYTST